MSGMNTKQLVISKLWGFLVPLVFAGCHKPASAPVIAATAEHSPVASRRIVGTSIENRPIECLVAGQGQDTTFILATIHGDEPAGTPLVLKLAEYLQQHHGILQGRKIVLLPVANPDGMAHNARHNARGVDLNRNFAAANRLNNALHGYAALSEPEARTIERLIREYAVDRIVGIHQLTDSGPEALSHRVPNGCIDYDGPAKALAHRMAECCGLPMEKLGAEPGSLGSYAGLTLGIPVITVELPLYARLLDSQLLWERYGTALIAAVVYPDRVNGK
jgi:protein MpaA